MTNYIKVLQKEMLAIICPLAGHSHLNGCKDEHALTYALKVTYQHIPLVYVLECINTNVKLFHEA